MSQRVVRKKVSIKKVSIFILTVILLITLFVFRISILYFIQSKLTGYSFDTISYAHKYNIYKDVRKHKYSLTLDKIINTDSYDNQYYEYYLNTKYRNRSNYFGMINSLFTLGYNDNDVNVIYDILDDEDIKILLDNDYYNDIVNLLKLSYFKKDKLSRYLNYAENSKVGYEDIVTYVNIGLDKEYYTDMVVSANTDDVLILVNKYNYLSKDYTPSDLESIDSKYNKGANNKLRHVAKESFEAMCDAALKDGIKIYSGSAFRSYSYQANLYNKYVNIDGKKKADTYAARAGHSEHQTGLALDIMNAKYQFLSSGDEEHIWLLHNSYKYGFILRYPKDKEDITGYMFEEWHFRYVGKEVAKTIHDEDITFDEYMARK